MSKTPKRITDLMLRDTQRDPRSGCISSWNSGQIMQCSIQPSPELHPKGQVLAVPWNRRVVHHWLQTDLRCEVRKLALNLFEQRRYVSRSLSIAALGSSRLTKRLSLFAKRMPGSKHRRLCREILSLFCMLSLLLAPSTSIPVPRIVSIVRRIDMKHKCFTHDL